VSGAESLKRGTSETAVAERRGRFAGAALIAIGAAAVLVPAATLAAFLLVLGRPADAAFAASRLNAGVIAAVLILLIVGLLASTALLVREIARHRAALRAMREREAEFRTVMDHAPVAFFIKDRELRYRLINRRFSEWAQTPLDFIGRTDEEIYPPDFAALSRASDIEALEQGRVVQMERPTHHARKGIEALLVTKFPIRDSRNAIVGIVGVLVDVTARTRTEVALRESRELLIESQRLGKTGYIVSELSSGRIYWSETVFDLRKVPPRPFFSLEETLQFLHPDDRVKYMEARNAGVKERRQFQVDLRVIRGDGSEAWERSVGHPRFDKNGKLTGVLVVLQDITESKLAEEALRQKEAELRAILDNAPVAIFLKDLSRRYRLVNRTYAEWFADLAERLVGHTADEIYPPEIAAKIEAGDRIVLERGLVDQWERAPERARAGIEQILTTKFPVRDESGAIVGLAGFISDVTARSRAENALRQSEERYRALIEHSNDIVAIVGSDGVITYRSPSMPEGLGYSLEERLSRSVFDLVHSEDRDAVVDAFKSVAAAPGRRADGRSRMRHKNGTWRHFLWTARNATNVPGVDGIIVNARDITESQRLEEQLQQALKMEAIGRLAGGIAHDFNNILGAILGFAGFLVQDLPPGSPVHEFAQRIVSAGERGKDIVQQILAFSWRGDLERAPHDLRQILRDAEPLLRASVPASTALYLEIEGDGLVAEVNAGQMTQILLNLCINASDALKGEAGRVTISASRKLADTEIPAPLGGLSETGRGTTSPVAVVSGSLQIGRAYAAIAVADTGIGMSEEVMRHIFDPFFTTKERGRGTGLGLSVVHGIVVGYDGACAVRSGVGAPTRTVTPVRPTRSTLCV